MQPFNSVTKLDDTFEFELTRLANTEYLAGDCMIGQLTEIGYKQHIYNGQGLRQRYTDNYLLLPDVYSDVDYTSGTITLRADNSLRTQHSAMALFTGMYQDSIDGDGNDTIHVQLFTQDEETDIILPNDNICPNYKKTIEKGLLTNETIDHYLNVTIPLLYQLDEFLADPGYRFTDVMNAFDCITVYACHDKTLPKQVTKDLYNEISEDVSWYENRANTYPDRVNGSLNRVGPLLKITMERFEAMVESKGNNNDLFYLYSGHDTGPIIPMLGALGYDLEIWTPYASLITLELYEKSGNFYVMASFNGQVLTLPSPCDSSSNEHSLCSYDKFESFMKEMIPSVDECPGLDLHGTVLDKVKKSSFEALEMDVDKVFGLKKH